MDGFPFLPQICPHFQMESIKPTDLDNDIFEKYPIKMGNECLKTHFNGKMQRSG
jgi:hypothetical protein